MSGRPSTGGPKLRRLNMGQVFIILAIISAIFTVVLFKNLSGNKDVPKAVKTEQKTLVVAAHDILSGEPFTAESIKTVDWPANQYPEGEVYENADKLMGRVAKDNIYMGQPIYRQMLSGEGSKGGLPVVIPKGYRAMTILVSENKGVGGFIKPGDHVDIVGTFEFTLPDSTQKALAEQAPLLEGSVRTAQTVLQDVQVLAIAQEMYEKSEGGSSASTPAPDSKAAAPSASASPAASAEEATKGKVVSSVTLAVTPEQAEKLAYADAKGDLRLTLRPEGEREEVHLLGTVEQDVISLNKILEKFTGMGSSFMPPSFASAPAIPPSPSASMPPMPPPVMAPPGKTVEIIQGAEKSSVSF